MQRNFLFLSFVDTTYKLVIFAPFYLVHEVHEISNIVSKIIQKEPFMKNPLL